MINTSATLEISGKLNKFEICIYEVSVLELCVFRGLRFQGLCCCSLCFKGLHAPSLLFISSNEEINGVF